MSAIATPRVLRVVLVRHADAGRPSGDVRADSRRLTAAGEVAAQRLAQFGLFDRAAGFYAGPEARMGATIAAAAQAHGQVVVAMPALAEAAAGASLADGPFREAVHRYFTELDVAAAPGWEPSRAVVRRVGGQIDALRGATPPDVNPDRVVPGIAVVATGGRAAVAFLADRLGWAATQAVRVWTHLRLPDLAIIDLPLDGAPRLVMPFGSLPV